MYQGYGTKRRAHILPIIRSKQSFKMENLLKQKNLIQQVRQLDQKIKNDNMIIINGLIFTSQNKTRLIEDLTSCVRKEHNLISYGFQAWKEVTSDKKQQQKVNQILRKSTFKQKLYDISIKNLEEYEIQKRKQLSRIQNTKQMSNPARQKATKINISQQYGIIQNRDFTSTANTPKKHMGQHSYSTRKKIYTETSERKPQQIAISQKIKKMLFSNTYSIISIWLPPKSYPQFYGIFVPAFSKVPPFRCRIKKYIFFRQGLNKRFFQAMIHYLDKIKQICISHMEMILNKSDFYQYFEPCGWKMKSWEGVDRIMAVYSLSYSDYQ